MPGLLVEFKNQEGTTLAGILIKAAGSSNKAVILCHGVACTKDSVHLPELAAALSQQGLNSLRFDFSGNGDSSGTFRFANYDEEVEEIRCAKEYLETVHQQDVVGLVGHSKGGNDVLLYASKYDDIPTVVNMAGRLYMDQGILQHVGQNVFEEVKRGPKAVRLRRPDGFEFEGHVTQQDLETRLAMDMAAAVARIRRSKVLTVHGEADAVIPVQDARDYAGLMPGSELVVIEGADHFFSKEPSHAAQLVRVVVEYLTRICSGERLDQA